MTASLMNRMHLAGNPFQMDIKKVLCVCSAGLLRSPTTAVVLAGDPWNYNTRAAGVFDAALVPVDEVLINWADEIVCMEEYHTQEIRDRFLSKVVDQELYGKPKIITLGIPDTYRYRQPELVDLITEAYTKQAG